MTSPYLENPTRSHADALARRRSLTSTDYLRIGDAAVLEQRKARALERMERAATPEAWALDAFAVQEIDAALRRMGKASK